MSSMPGRKLRSRTSDLAEFLRSNPRIPAGDLQDTPTHLQLPTSSSRPESIHSSKGKRTRIPFLGLGRRKSSGSPERPLISPTSGIPPESLPPLPNTTRKSLGSGHVVLMISPSGESSQPLPLPTTSPTSDTSQHTLASKFAAHFTPSKSKNSARRHGPPPQQPEFRPASTQRSSSPDSMRSKSDGNRSPTPRGKRPTITVSSFLPSDPFDYQRYTPTMQTPTPARSRNTTPPLPSLPPIVPDLSDDPPEHPPKPPSTPTSPTGRLFFASRVDLSSTGDANMWEPLENSSRTRSSESDPSDRSSRRNTPTPTLRRDQSDSCLSSKGHRHSVSVVKVLENVLGTSVDLDSGEESDDVASDAVPVTIAPHAPDSPNEFNRWAVLPSTPNTPSDLSEHSRSESSSRRSSRALTSSSSSQTLSGPPSIPLPRTPDLGSRTSLVSLTALPAAPLGPSLSTRKSNSSIRSRELRPRAHTISSGVPQPSALSTTPITSRPSSSASLLRSKFRIPDSQSNSDASDREGPTDAMSRVQLKLTLDTQIARFQELAGYLVVLKQVHSEEKAVLEHRIASLEADAEKREKELQGLRWLVMHGTGASMASGERTSPSRPLSKHGDDGKPNSRRSPRHKEDRRTSSTGPSRSSTSPRPAKSSPVLSEDLKLARGDSHAHKKTDYDTAKAARHVSSSTLPIPVEHTKANGLSESPTSDSSQSIDKRSSVSSFSSAGSSSSSHPPTTPTLSAIPETLPSKLKLPRLDPAIVAAIQDAEKQREKGENTSRRNSRALKRLSGSGSGSGSGLGPGLTSPGSPLSSNIVFAHASSIKRCRPPSFAQAMDSADMNGVLEKLRAFSGQVTPPAS